MDLYFDFEKTATPEQLKDLFSGVTGAIFKEIKSFIKQRWRVFDDELAKYGDSKVVIKCATNPFRIALHYYGLPEELRKKMEDSISQDDLKYLAVKMNDAQL